MQHLLGHARLSVIEIQTHVAIHKLNEVHTATHPARLPEAAWAGRVRPRAEPALAGGRPAD